MSSPTHLAFASLALDPALLQVVEELGYEHATPIQARSIPLLLKGRDLIGQSRTGSGKTAAFALPILQRVQPRWRVPQALILCPTRELCAQVAREVRKLGRRSAGLQVIVLSGGMPFRPQALALENGAHIVVGTPGRVLDHLTRETLHLDRVATVVLDEADRMLDMGFEDDMQAILGACPKSRQTVLFSATFPPSIETMSAAHQINPARVTIESDERETIAIRQAFVQTPFENKMSVLRWLLRERQPESTVVFCNHKATSAELAAALTEAGMSAACLHGDLEQRDRDQVMAKFRNRSVRALIATDVAARGIDVENVDVVFNYDLPSKPEVYVHRIGRTGRAGRNGWAISLATPREQHKLEAIEAYTQVTLERIPTPDAHRIEIQEVQEPLTQAAAMATLRLGAGRKDKLRPGDILGALTGEAGRMSAELIGKIEIHDRFAYVAVAKHAARAAALALLNGRVKGRKIGVELVQ